MLYVLATTYSLRRLNLARVKYVMCTASKLTDNPTQWGTQNSIQWHYQHLLVIITSYSLDLLNEKCIF